MSKRDQETVTIEVELSVDALALIFKAAKSRLGKGYKKDVGKTIAALAIVAARAILEG